MSASEVGRGAYLWGTRLEQVVMHHARECPGAVAVRQDNRIVTYGELVTDSLHVAAGLSDLGVDRGSVVAVALGRCPELVTAILGILAADATYTVIDSAWPESRRLQAISDAGCNVVIDHATFERILHSGSASPLARAPVQGDGSDAATIFYTSGSTGRPKGIRSPHRGPIRTLVGHDDLPFDASTVFLQAAPLPWDGLSLELWGALLNGGEVRLLPAGRRTLDALVLADLVRDGVDTMWLTSSLFHVLAETAADVLSRLRLLVVGGERVSGRHVIDVLRQGGRVRIVNGYGPAETTIFATTRVLDEACGAEVPIGRAVPHTELLVVDPSSGVPGSTGELWIGGDGVALGYLDADDDAGRFVERDGRRFYRSGDLVRTVDDELWFEGRVDDQVKVGGVRIDPAHVEHVLASVSALSGVHVTVTRVEAEDRRLVCVYTTHSGDPVGSDELTDRARQQLISAMVPALWIHVDRLPLTTHGKIDRRRIGSIVAERAPARTGKAAASSSDLDLVRAVTGVPQLESDDDIVAQVHSSLQVVRLAGHLSSRWNRPVSVADVFRHRSLAALVEIHGVAGPPERGPATGIERPTRAELRFWLAEQLDPGACDNVLVLSYHLDAVGIEDRLVEGVRRVLAESPALLTVYVDHGDLPEALLAAPENVPVTRHRTEGTDAVVVAREHTARWWDRPFDLGTETPFRAEVVTLGDGTALLCAHVHHIAFDGWSESLFLDHLLRHLESSDPAGPVTSEANALSRTSAARDEALAHWRSIVKDLPDPVLPAPTGPGEAARDERVTTLEPSEVLQLSSAAARAGVHPATATVAALAAALGQHFGTDHVSIGTVVPERFDALDQSLIGYFVNPVPIVVGAARSATAPDLLRLVAEQLAVAERHGFVPFEDVAALASRSVGRHPVFQVWAVLQHARTSRRLKGLGRLRPIRLAPPRTSTELMVEVTPGDVGWEVVTFWRTDGVSTTDGQAVHDRVVERLRRAPQDLFTGRESSDF